MCVIRPGCRYRHFKDKRYEVLAIAEHTETGEKLVIYGPSTAKAASGPAPARCSPAKWTGRNTRRCSRSTGLKR